MSKGNGKVELSVLDFLEREQDKWGNFPLWQSWLVRQLEPDFLGPAIRRAIKRLSDKGQIYRFDDVSGVLISLSPITEKKIISPHSFKEVVAPLEPYKPCPVADFEPIVLDCLKQGEEKRSRVTQKILRSIDGCWENAYHPKRGNYISYHEPSLLKLNRTIARMIKDGKIHFFYRKSDYHRRGIGKLSLYPR